MMKAPLLLAFACVAITSQANCQTLQPRTARVSYADLDLASAAGRATFERRVDAAADAVCGRNGYAGLAELRAAAACHSRAVEGAMGQVMTAGAGTVQFAAVEVSAAER
jgi:UrcA family protein